MIRRAPPPWFAKAKALAARVKSPAGRPFAAKQEDKVAKLYIYDAIGYDYWSDTGIDPMDIVAAVEEAKGSDALEIHINSPGGYITDGFAIFNAIRGFAGPKTSYVDGIAASMASLIALAGDRVVTNEGAMWMIHEAVSGLYTVGTADEIEADAAKAVNALRKMSENLLDVYVNATGQRREQIAEWLKAETWMGGEEAMSRGFTDEIAKQPPAEPDETDEPGEPSDRMESPAELIARARAQRGHIQSKFPGATRAATPGKPGTTTPEKENRR